MANLTQCRVLEDQVGVGIRSRHYLDIIAGDHEIPWFEALTENYLDSYGRPRDLLLQIAERYPISTHGVSLSIGSEPNYRSEHLAQLREFIEVFNPFLVTDHLCWTATTTHNSHDLLPLPWTQQVKASICRHIDHVQKDLGQSIALENISQYVGFADSSYQEWEFMNEVCAHTGCGWLLDINNVFVNSYNFGFDPKAYIDRVDPQTVWQYHIAGHTDCGSYLFDTHVGPVPESVVELFRYAVATIGRRPTLVEWDTDVPEFSILVAEQQRIQDVLSRGVPWT